MSNHPKIPPKLSEKALHKYLLSLSSSLSHLSTLDHIVTGLLLSIHLPSLPNLTPSILSTHEFTSLLKLTRSKLPLYHSKNTLTHFTSDQPSPTPLSPSLSELSVDFGCHEIIVAEEDSPSFGKRLNVETEVIEEAARKSAKARWKVKKRKRCRGNGWFIWGESEGDMIGNQGWPHLYHGKWLYEHVLEKIDGLTFPFRCPHKPCRKALPREIIWGLLAQKEIRMFNNLHLINRVEKGKRLLIWWDAENHLYSCLKKGSHYCPIWEVSGKKNIGTNIRAVLNYKYQNEISDAEYEQLKDEKERETVCSKTQKRHFIELKKVLQTKVIRCSKCSNWKQGIPGLKNFKCTWGYVEVYPTEEEKRMPEELSDLEVEKRTENITQDDITHDNVTHDGFTQDDKTVGEEKDNIELKDKKMKDESSMKEEEKMKDISEFIEKEKQILQGLGWSDDEESTKAKVNKENEKKVKVKKKKRVKRVIKKVKKGIKRARSGNSRKASTNKAKRRKTSCN
jgi:hypothetical protein